MSRTASRTAKSTTAQVSRKRAARGRTKASGGPRNALLGLQHAAGNRAVGTALEDKTRNSMEARFGRSFSDVRVHTDPQASQAAEKINAAAFTHGQDIYFRNGRFNPDSQSGQTLIAHELAHVIQQGRGGGRPGASQESAADAAAQQVSVGAGPVSVAGASAPAVAAKRDDDFRRMQKEDQDWGRQEHADRMSERGGIRAREQGRSQSRSQAFQTEPKQAKDLNREWKSMLEKAESGGYSSSMSQQNKVKLMDRFWKKLQKSNLDSGTKSRIKGAFGEHILTPSAAKAAGHVQRKFVSGVHEMKGMKLDYKTPHTQSDYWQYKRRPDGTVVREHPNIKSDEIHKMTPSEARARARQYTKQAVKNARHLPEGSQVPIKYARRGASPEIEKMMAAEHMHMQNGPIHEVHFGTTVYRPEDVADEIVKLNSKKAKAPKKAPKKTGGKGKNAKPAAAKKTKAASGSGKGSKKGAASQGGKKAPPSHAGRPSKPSAKKGAKGQAAEPGHAASPVSEHPPASPAAEAPKPKGRKGGAKAAATPSPETPAGAPVTEGGETATQTVTKKATKGAAAEKKPSAGQRAAGEQTRPKRATAKPAADAPKAEPKAPETHTAAPESHAPAPPAPSESAKTTPHTDHTPETPAGERGPGAKGPEHPAPAPTGEHAPATQAPAAHALETAPGAKPKVAPGGEPHISAPAVAHPAPAVKPTPPPAKTNVQAPAGKVEVTGTPHVGGGEPHGFHPPGAPEVHLNVPGGSKLAGIKKLGKFAGPAINAATTGLGLYQDLKEGQKPGEAIAGAAGNFAANHLYSGGPVDTAINLANTGLQLAGAPKAVTDTTQVVSEVTPSSFIGSMAKQGARGIYNIATGDMKAVDKQVQEMEQGKAGGPLQGYAMITDLVSRKASGESWDHALNEVAKMGQGSTLQKAGDYLGDEAFQFINKDLPEASEFAKKDLERLKDSTKEKLSKAWHWVAD